MKEQDRTWDDTAYEDATGETPPDTGGTSPGRFRQRPRRVVESGGCMESPGEDGGGQRVEDPPEISVMDTSLKTTHLLKISRSGELLDKKLLISSGNSPFDRSVHLALNSVTTLPPPPLVLIAGQSSVEVTMSFTPPKGVR